MDTKNNSGTDIDVLTKFQPMPKRFMVWDKPNGQFLTISNAYPKCQISEGEQKSVIFSLQDLIALFSEVLYYDNRGDYIVCQSTNLFDEDGQEVLFQRPDGTLSEFNVGVGGTGKNGEVLFYEIIAKLDNGKIDGKQKYKRVIIQRVYPVVKSPGLLEEHNA